ncbi:MAG: hypothetical protein DWQ05_20310 [Calditrichaeota bacterium]|nr:MAG: hypothetical protein DWQ05_20310 [Calditrichota bacterium]
MLTFYLNQNKIATSLHHGTVLLDFVRRESRLPGTKEGCREGDCGACTVLLGEIADEEIKYRAVNSCLLPIGSLAGKHVVTIEGLNLRENTLLQNAFVDEHASQCGFCTPGFILSLTDFLLNNPTLNFEEAILAVAGNICRCTGYESIKRAIKLLLTEVESRIELSLDKRVPELVRTGQLPEYFNTIPQKLARLEFDVEPENPGKIVAGGTDLFVQQADKLLKQPLQFIDDGQQSREIYRENDQCIVGASATMEEVRKTPVFREILPEIDTYSKLIASKPIRERATLAGNIVNASPIADFVILLLALEAKLILQIGSASRTVDLHNFYLGYKKLDLQEDEHIHNISIPIPNPGFKFNFEKVSRRTHLDIASVNTAAFFAVEENKITDARISAGGVAPIPLLLKNTNAFLQDKIIDPAIVESAMKIAAEEISPISDVRGSAEYKRRLLQQFIFAHFHTQFPELIGAEVLA